MKNILKLRLNRHLLSLAMGVGMLGVLIVGNVGTALADDNPINFSVTGGTQTVTTGTLGLKDQGDGTVTSFALNGHDQNVTITMPVTVTDARGTGAGWTIKLYASQFTNGDGHTLTNPPAIGTLATSNLTPTDSSSPLQATPSDEFATATNGASVPTASSSELTLLKAAGGSGYGMGSYTLNVPMTLTIAAKDYAGSNSNHYTSTFTFDIAAAI